MIVHPHHDQQYEQHTPTPPHLFAIPGNHDWYDGLASFLKLFCQGRWVGGWKTRQRRSYFAIRLPHGWWLWGVDVQLESDIDKPQIDFFRTVASRMEQEAGGVIGEPIAELRPLPPDTSVPAALLKLSSTRAVTLPVRKAMVAFRPIQSRGRALSEAILEDREDRF